MSAPAGAEALRELLTAEGGDIAAVIEAAPMPAAEARDLAALAASGPRCAAHPGEVALAVRAVLEGARLHYGDLGGIAPVVPIEDPDLALLAGDRLYALGLARLAGLGDLDAIAELADVIALCAQAEAASEPALASAAWELGAAAIGWGSDPELVAAKAAARAGDAAAGERMRAAGRARVRRDDVS